MTVYSVSGAAGAEIIQNVKEVAGDLEGVTSVDVELVWDPYWTPEMMDPRVKAFLGY
jgi:metal-sulfur cluster biosynthetic enzyme